MRSFTNCPKKRAVQTELLSLIPDSHDGTVLLGPEPKEYITLLRSSVCRVPHIIHGYDKEWCNEFNRSKYVFTYKRDIYWAPATTFIDLDLCAGILANKYLIFNMWEKQCRLAGPKAFMFTLSLRNNTGQKSSDILASISDMIGYKLNDKWLGNKRRARYKNDRYEIYIITYSDTTPMMTVLINH